MNLSQGHSRITRIYPFWAQLQDQLDDVLDAHGVCSATAKSLADSFGEKVIVALRDPSAEHIDTWVCDPSMDPLQTRWFNSATLIELIVNHGEPLALDESEEKFKATRHSEIWNLDLSAFTAVPVSFPTIRNEGQIAAVIFLADPGNQQDLAGGDLEVIASQVAVYLERALLRQASDRQQVEFGLVSDIGISITSSLEIDDIAISVADATRRALGVERISIALVDTDSNTIEFIRSIMEFQDASIPNLSLPLGEGISGWVAEKGEPALVNDAYRDDRFFPGFDTLTGYKTHSVLCVPLKIENEVIGVLEAVNKIQGSFSEGDLRLLQAITGPLAIAIQNAQMHDSVIEEKRRVETIFASMSEGMLTANSDGKITATNDAFLSLIDRKDEELMGRDLGEVILTRQPGFVEFIELISMEDSQFQQLICDIQNKDGGFVPVIISGASIKQASGDVGELVLVLSDLTQIREIERMRDDFFSNIVHELHTPLASILMYARLLRKGKAEGDEDKKNRFLEIIEQESNRLQIMVRQMLHLAKLQAAEIRVFEDTAFLNPVFDQLIPPLRRRAEEKGLTFKLNVRNDLPKVRCDEETLYMIFKNLVENAIKFTPAGTVSLDARADDEWVYVTVSDDGIGIPPEGIPNLFSRFYRARTAVERGIGGTGLGLHMVKEGLDYCGGKIEVESEVGKGTTFLVRVLVA